MRKFIAGFCCLVVGVQVLVGVPLAVCLGFYMLAGGGPPSVAYDSYSSGSYPATVPPPNYSPPPHFPSSPVVPPLMPMAAPLPIAAGADIPASLPLPLSPAASAAILESRERIGNPLAGTILEPPTAGAGAVDLGPALQNITHEAALPTTDVALPAAETPAAPAPNGAATAGPAPAADLEGRLQECVQQLGGLATPLEEQGQFGRADQIRRLVRALRREATP